MSTCEICDAVLDDGESCEHERRREAEADADQKEREQKVRFFSRYGD